MGPQSSSLLPGTAYGCLVRALENTYDNMYDVEEYLKSNSTETVVDDEATGKTHSISAFVPTHHFDRECAKLLRVAYLNPSVSEALGTADASTARLVGLDGMGEEGSLLTGGWALAAVASLVLVTFYGLFVAYRKWRRQHLYTLVAKRRPDGV